MSTQKRESHHCQLDTDRYALQCYNSGLGFAVLGEGMRLVGIPAGKA